MCPLFDNSVRLGKMKSKKSKSSKKLKRSTTKKAPDTTMRADELESKVVEEFDHYVPAEDVVTAMQTALQQKDMIIDKRRSKVDKLQIMVRKDHQEIEDLDRKITVKSANTAKVEDENKRLNEKFEILHEKMLTLDMRKLKVQEESHFTRQKRVRLMTECNTLAQSIEQMEKSHKQAEETLGRLQETYLALSTEVRNLELKGDALKEFKNAHNVDELENKIRAERERFFQLQSMQNEQKMELQAKEAEICQWKTQNAKLERDIKQETQREKELKAEKTRRFEKLGEMRQIAHEVGMAKDMLVSKEKDLAYEKKLVKSAQGEYNSAQQAKSDARAEIAKIKVELAGIEKQLNIEKRIMIDAQAKLVKARKVQFNAVEVARMEAERARSEELYRSLKQSKRELENRVRSLTELACDLKDGLNTADSIAHSLRRQIVKVKQEQPKLYPVFVRQPSDFAKFAKIESQIDDLRRGRFDIEKMAHKNLELSDRIGIFASNLCAAKEAREERFTRDKYM